MANRNRIHVVLIDRAGDLIHRQKDWGDDLGSSSGIELQIQSGLQVIAVFVVKDVNGEASGPFWDEYSGRSMIAVQESFEGISVAQHDVTPEATDLRETLNTGELRPKRYIESKLASATMGKGANWDVYEDGQGLLYIDKLSAARQLVGYPGA